MKKILVIDDEKDLVEVIELRLSSLGYKVLTAYDGQTGLEKARADKPDLIVLDLMLPKIDGHKVCGLLKQDSRFRHIPIMMFTARADPKDRGIAEELGADAYLTKPFEMDSFLETIKKLLKE